MVGEGRGGAFRAFGHGLPLLLFPTLFQTLCPGASVWWAEVAGLGGDTGLPNLSETSILWDPFLGLSRDAPLLPALELAERNRTSGEKPAKW